MSDPYALLDSYSTNADPYSALDAYTPPPPAKTGLARTAGDVGIKLAQGVVDLGQQAVGLGGLVSGGAVSRGMRNIGYDPERTNQFLGDYLSPAQQQADSAVQNADGVVNTLGQAIEHPRAILGTVTRSLPGTAAAMSGVGGVAKMIGSRAAAGLTGEAATLASRTALDKATGTLLTTGAVMEGAQTSGQIADQASAAGRNYSDYALPALGAGALTGAINKVSGHAFGDISTDIMAGTKTMRGSLPVRVLKGAGTEGLAEEAPQSGQEQYFTNVAMGEPDRTKGVGNAIATGGLSGIVMGGAFGAASGPLTRAAATIPPTLQNQTGDPNVRTNSFTNLSPDTGNVPASGAIQQEPASGPLNQSPNTAFLQPGELRRHDLTRRAQAVGITDPRILNTLVPKETLDAVTGYYPASDKVPTVKRALAHVNNTGETAYYVEADIANLGGLNSHFKNNSELANPVYRAISDIFAEEMAAAGVTAVNIRHGGDEFGSVVIGGTQESIAQAKNNTHARIEALMEAQGLHTIPHAKSKPEAPKPNGVHLYMGHSEILPGKTLEDIFKQSSSELDSGKIGALNVGRKETGTVGDEALNRQTGGASTLASANLGESGTGGREVTSGIRTTFGGQTGDLNATQNPSGAGTTGSSAIRRTDSDGRAIDGAGELTAEIKSNDAGTAPSNLGGASLGSDREIPGVSAEPEKTPAHDAGQDATEKTLLEPNAPEQLGVSVSANGNNTPVQTTQVTEDKFKKQPVDTHFESVLKLKGIITHPNGLYQIPERLMTPGRREKIGDTWQGLPREQQSNQFRIGRMGDVTGNWSSKDANDTVIYDEKLRAANRLQRTQPKITNEAPARKAGEYHPTQNPSVPVAPASMRPQFDAGEYQGGSLTDDTNDVSAQNSIPEITNQNAHKETVTSDDGAQPDTSRENPPAAIPGKAGTPAAESPVVAKTDTDEGLKELTLEQERSHRQNAGIVTSQIESRDEKTEFANFAEANNGLPVQEIRSNLVRTTFGKRLATKELTQVTESISAAGNIVADQARKNANRVKTELTAEQNLQGNIKLETAHLAAHEKALSEVKTEQRFTNGTALPIPKAEVQANRDRIQKKIDATKAKLADLQKLVEKTDQAEGLTRYASKSEALKAQIVAKQTLTHTIQPAPAGQKGFVLAPKPLEFDTFKQQEPNLEQSSTATPENAQKAPGTETSGTGLTSTGKESLQVGSTWNGSHGPRKIEKIEGDRAFISTNGDTKTLDVSPVSEVVQLKLMDEARYRQAQGQAKLEDETKQRQAQYDAVYRQAKAQVQPEQTAAAQPEYATNKDGKPATFQTEQGANTLIRIANNLSPETHIPVKKGDVWYVKRITSMRPQRKAGEYGAPVQNTVAGNPDIVNPELTQLQAAQNPYNLENTKKALAKAEDEYEAQGRIKNAHTRRLIESLKQRIAAMEYPELAAVFPDHPDLPKYINSVINFKARDGWKNNPIYRRELQHHIEKALTDKGWSESSAEEFALKTVNAFTDNTKAPVSKPLAQTIDNHAATLFATYKAKGKDAAQAEFKSIVSGNDLNNWESNALAQKFQALIKAEPEAKPQDRTKEELDLRQRIAKIIIPGMFDNKVPNNSPIVSKILNVLKSEPKELEQALIKTIKDSGYSDIYAKDSARELVKLVKPQEQAEGPALSGAEGYGANNKLFTKDAADAARERLKAKLGRLNSGFDPEMMLDGLTLAGYHVEAGARTYARYAKAMIDDLGNGIIPYLQHFYNSVRDYPGFDNKGMASYQALEFSKKYGIYQGELWAYREEAAREVTDLDEHYITFKTPSENGSQQVPTTKFLQQKREWKLINSETVDSDKINLTDAKKAQESGNANDTLRTEPLPGESALTDSSAGKTGDGNGESLDVGVAQGDQSLDSVGAVPGGTGIASGTGSRGDHGKPGATLIGTGKTGTSGTKPVAAERSEDHTISDSDELGKGGLAKKYKDNISAIKIVKALEAENRIATPEERKQLAKYVGWGALKQVFDKTNSKYAKQHEELKGLLTEEEWRAALASVRNAHFTSPVVVKFMYTALDRMGFKGGRLLEPALGSGNFFGLMPASLRNKSSLHGVELDSLTSRLAKYLYPNAVIATATGFQDYQVPSGYFDVTIGNPPFGEETITDKERNAYSGFSIHNYFLARMLDKTRDGGIVPVIVSNSFMDSIDDKARRYMAAHANLVGAVRLPNTAFKENAGTEVVTDILFFQNFNEAPAHKAGEYGTGTNSVPENPEKNPAWLRSSALNLTNTKTGETASVNRNDYYRDHPENVLGQETAAGTMYRANSYTVTGTGDLATQLDGFVKSLPEGLYQSIERSPEQQVVVDEAIPNGVKAGSFYLNAKGEVQQRGPDVAGQKTTLPWLAKDNSKALRMRSLIKLRDSLRTQLRMELEGKMAPAIIESHRTALNQLYDAFVKQYGFVNSQVNHAVFRDDTESALVEALEFDYDAGISKAVAVANDMEEKAPSAAKSDILKRRVLFPYQDRMNVQSAQDALLASLDAKGRLDLDYMTRLYDKSEADIIQELGELVYNDPQLGYVMADEYLSGDVKTKLAEAKAAYENDSALKRNVTELTKVIPADKLPSEIRGSIGAAWIPSAVYKKFAALITGAAPGSIKIHYVPATANWLTDLQGTGDIGKLTNEFGTNRISSFKLFELMLANRAPVIKDSGATRDDPPVINEAATEAAKAQTDKIKALWQSWLWSDAEQSSELAGIFNDKHNRIVPRKYNGAHLTLPGKSPAITLRPHQMDAVWRAVQDRNVLLDQVVGSGKTFIVVASVMEMKRLGIARKPLIAVPNHLVSQWRSDFSRLYPSANVLAATPADFTKENRKRFFAKIATGDFDAIIVGHSSLKKLSIDPEIEQKLHQEQIQEIAEAIEELKRERGDRNIIRDMEGIKANLESKLQALVNKAGTRDQVVNFSELGIDGLVVDELHYFKGLYFTTQRQRVAGLGNPTGSGMAFDLFMKIRWLQTTLGPKAPLITATGTPVSNSLAEMFTMQRFMRYDDLKRDGLHLFDAWANLFGETEHLYEVAPSGVGYRISQRFSKFSNLPTLMPDYQSFADVVTLSDLKAQSEARGERFPVPTIEGGRPTNVVATRSPLQRDFFGVPFVVEDEQGNIVYEIDPKQAKIEKNPEGKWVLSDPGTATSLHNTQEDANLELVEKALTPQVSIDPQSIVGQFSNLRELTRNTKGQINALSLTGLANKAGLDYRLIDPNAPDFADSKINKAVAKMLELYRQTAADKGTQLAFSDLSVPASARTAAAAKDMRVFVLTPAGVLTHKQGTLHTVAGQEGLPFYLVRSGMAANAVVTVYEPVTGAEIKTGFADKQSAKAWVSNVLSSDKTRDHWFYLRERNEPLSQERIAAYREEKALEVDTDGSNEISLDELEGFASASRFSVYDDIKAKLIAGGVKPNEIAFIHDYDTPKKKEALFKRVNSGDIRFLLGSTQKMGAGTNVQERLVALHHIDAPWRPSDLEQREGRIIRQGNLLYQRDPEGFRIFIGRYATEQTYDTRRWQLLEHKAAAIEQLRHYSGELELEDVATEASNSADMKAAASGNPLILEETALRGEVKRLTLLQSAHADGLYTQLRDKKWAQREVDTYIPKQIKELKGYLDTAKAHPLIDDPKKTADFQALGKTTNDKAKALELLTNTIDAVHSKKADSLAMTYRGITFKLQTGGFGIYWHTSLMRPDGYEMEQWPSEKAISPSGVMTRLNNFINALPDRLAKAQADLEQARADIDRLTKSLKTPFDKTEELTQATLKHKEIQRQLMNATQLDAVPVEKRAAFLKERAARQLMLTELGYGEAVKEASAGTPVVEKPDQGTVLFSQRSAGSGTAINRTAIASVINRVITPSHISRNTVIVVDGFAGLPEAVRKVATQQGYDPANPKQRINGVTYQGKIYIVHGHVQSEIEVEEVLLHERIHQILHGDTADPQGQKLSAALNNLYLKLGGIGGMNKLAESLGIDFKDARQQALQMKPGAARNAFLVDEFLAEAEGRRAYEHWPEKVVRALREFYGKLRTWLRANGFTALANSSGMKLNDFTPADLARLLRTIRLQEAGSGSDAVRFSFAGLRAVTADRYALENAQQRLYDGENTEQVRKDTGWHRAKDGKWRFEIDDSDARLKNLTKGIRPKYFEMDNASLFDMFSINGTVHSQQNNTEDFYYSGELDNVLNHDALFAAYPDIRNTDTKLTIDHNFNDGLMGWYKLNRDYSDKDSQTVSSRYDARPMIELTANNKENALSGLLHEIQHSIQFKEGYAQGGLPDLFNEADMQRTRERVRDEDADVQKLYAEADSAQVKGDIKKALSLYRQADRETNFTAYQRLAGEVEARNTQARQFLTVAERKTTPPGVTQDVQDSDQIIVWNGKVMASAPRPDNAKTNSSDSTQWSGGDTNWSESSQWSGGDTITSDAKTNLPASGEWSGDSINAKGYKTDVPNEHWLNEKIEDAKNSKRNKFGVPRMGSITTYFEGNKPILVSVEQLSKLNGERGEQANVRKEDLDFLKKVMSETGKLPLKDGQEYAPYVEIGYDGVPWVSEGNHRIMVAKSLGWSTLPVEVRYFDGGERTASEEWKPDALLQAQADSFKLSKSATENNGEFSLGNNGIRFSMRSNIEQTDFGQRATGIIDKVKNWSNNFDPLGTLTSKNDYLKTRYLTQGKIYEIDQVARNLYDTFKAAGEDKPKILHFLITKNASPAMIANPALRAQAEDTKNLFIDIGQELVDRGLLNEDTYKANKGGYLPQLYLRFMLKDKDIAALGTGKRPSTLVYLKQRAYQWQVAANGDVHLHDVETGVLLPDDKALALGPINDPGYLASKGYAVQMRDMAILDWLSEISQNAEWILPKSLVEWKGKPVTPYWLKSEAQQIRKQAIYYTDENKVKALDLANSMDEEADKALEGYENVPDGWKRIPNIKRYGAMRGLLVKAEIYDDIIGASQINAGDMSNAERLLGNGGLITHATQWWKWSKVAANIPSQVRNFISNGVLLHLSGVPFHKVPTRVIEAIKDIRSNGRYWQIAKQYGVTESTFAAKELPRIDREMLDLQAQTQGDYSWAHVRNLFGKLVDKTGDMYQLSEAIFKTAKIIDEMKKGASAGDAVLAAQEALFDYSLVQPSVRYLRNAPIGSPFLTFAIKALPQMVKIAATHPLRFAPYIAIPYILTALIASSADVDDDDVDKLKKALPEWLQKQGHAYLLPFKDSNKNWQALDLGYFFPWTQWTELGGQLSEGDFGEAFKGSGLLGGPLPDLISAAKTGIDPFTQKEIMDERDPPEKQIAALMGYLYRMAMPTWLTDIGAAGKTYEALTGYVDKKTGAPKTTLTQGLLRFGGINLYSINPMESRAANLRRMKFEIQDEKARRTGILKDRNLTQEERKAIFSQYNEIIKERRLQMKEYALASEVHPRLRTN